MTYFLWKLPEEALRFSSEDLHSHNLPESLQARFEHHAAWCLENSTNHEYLYLLEDPESSPKGLNCRSVQFVLNDKFVEIVVSPVTSFLSNLQQLMVINQIADSIPEGIAIATVNGSDQTRSRLVYLNQAVADIFGVEKIQLLSQLESSLLALILEPDKAAAYRQAQEQAKDIALQTTLQVKGREPITVHLGRSIVRDITGWCAHIALSIRDVSAIVAAGAENDRQRKLNDQMQKLARISWWELDLDAKTILRSEGVVAEISDLNPGKALPDVQQLMERVVVTDQPRIVKMINDAALEGAVSSAEIRLLDDGGNKWQRIQTQPGIVENGEVKTILGTALDITDIVQSEKLRLQQHQELEFYLTCLDEHALLLKLDGDMNINFANKKFVEALQYSHEELYELSFNNLLIEESRELVLRVLPILKNGQTWQGELAKRTKQGADVTIEVTMSSRLSDDGEIEEIFVFGDDVSLRKLSETVGLSISRLKHSDLYDPDLLWQSLKTLISISGSEAGFLQAQDVDIHWPTDIGPSQAKKKATTELQFSIQFREEVPGVLVLLNRPGGYPRGITEVLQPLVNFMVEFQRDRKRLEADQQHEYENKFVLETLKIGSWRHDIASRYWYFSDSLFSLLEFPPVPGGLVPKGLWDNRIPVLEQRKLLASMKDMFNTEENCDVTVATTLPNNERRYIKIQGRLSRDAHGEPMQVLGIASDVTSEVFTQRELENQKSLASHQARLASIGELAAGVGHEVNNPLTIIRGFLDIVKTQLDSDEPDVSSVTELINKMDDSALRIEKIVKGLRSLSHVDASEEEVFAPDPVLRDTVGFVDEIYRRQGVTLEMTSSVAGSVRIKGYEGKLQQVLMNLLSNARDATEGKVVRMIWADFFVEDQHLMMKIRDNGPGIAADIRERIFHPFFTTKEIGKGTGIGLSMVFSIVQEFNGRIDCINTESGGAQFDVALPLIVSEDTEKIDVIHTRSQPKTRLAGRVLVVDDEQGVREFLVLMLEQLGLSVDSAENGRHALEVVEQQAAYDVIMTDLTMPEMDGLEFVERLQGADVDSGNVKVLLTTGLPDFVVDLERYPLIVGLLTKPFNLSFIRTTLTQLGLAEKV